MYCAIVRAPVPVHCCVTVEIASRPASHARLRTQLPLVTLATWSDPLRYPYATLAYPLRPTVSSLPLAAW